MAFFFNVNDQNSGSYVYSSCSILSADQSTVVGTGLVGSVTNAPSNANTDGTGAMMVALGGLTGITAAQGSWFGLLADVDYWIKCTSVDGYGASGTTLQGLTFMFTPPTINAVDGFLVGTSCDVLNACATPSGTTIALAVTVSTGDPVSITEFITTSSAVGGVDATATDTFQYSPDGVVAYTAISPLPFTPPAGSGPICFAAIGGSPNTCTTYIQFSSTTLCDHTLRLVVANSIGITAPYTTTQIMVGTAPTTTLVLASGACNPTDLPNITTSFVLTVTDPDIATSGQAITNSCTINGAAPTTRELTAVTNTVGAQTLTFTQTTAGAYNILCTTTDGCGLTGTANLPITVNADTAPTIAGTPTASVQAGNGGALGFTLTDPDCGQTLTTTCSVTARPDGSATAEANDPVLIGLSSQATPASGATASVAFTTTTAALVGDYTISCTVSDSSLSNTATETITIQNPPTITMNTPTTMITAGGTETLSLTIGDVNIGQILTPTCVFTTDATGTTVIAPQPTGLSFAILQAHLQPYQGQLQLLYRPPSRPLLQQLQVLTMPNAQLPIVIQQEQFCLRLLQLISIRSRY